VLEQKLSSSDTANWLIAQTKYGLAKLKQRNEISRKQQCNTKCFCAFALGIRPLLPVLSTLFILDFITDMCLWCHIDTYKCNCRFVNTEIWILLFQISVFPQFHMWLLVRDKQSIGPRAPQITSSKSVNVPTSIYAFHYWNNVKTESSLENIIFQMFP
jgi:hypothetical protein